MVGVRQIYFHCVGVTVLFVVNKHLGKDTSGLRKYLVSPQSFTY